MQKRVLEVLKTWYFPYSAFWSAGQWGGGIAPPRPPPWLRYWLSLKILNTSKRIPQHSYQRWSPRGRPWPRGRPRGQILKSLALALASKVKSLALALASRPQVLENWPVLGSRTALFFGKLKFCGAVEKFFGKRFFVEIA